MFTSYIRNQYCSWKKFSKNFKKNYFFHWTVILLHSNCRDNINSTTRL